MQVPTTLAFWRPAIDSNAIENSKELSYEQHNSIFGRTALVVLGGMAILATSRISRYPWSPAVTLILLPLAWNKYEHFRAAKALDSLAADTFKKGTYVSPRIMEYMTTHPQAIQMLKDSGGDLSRIDDNGQSLMTHFLDNVGWKSCFTQQSFLLAFTQFLESGASINKDDFHILLFKRKTEAYELLECALKNDKVNVEEFSPEDIIKCWLAVPSHRENIGRLMHNKGFDINTTDSQGNTPLLQIIRECPTDIARICLFLRLGATVPDLDTATIEIKTKKENVVTTQKITLREWLKYNPRIVALLNHAQRLKSSSFARKNLDSYFFELWKPAVSVGGDYQSFEVAKDRIFTRTLTALYLIATTSLIATLNKYTFRTYFYGVSFLVAAAVAYHKYEWARSVKVLNALALEEFKNAVFPSANVTKYLARSETLVDQIISEPLALQQMDDNGNTLLDIVCNDRYSFDIRLSIFKKIIDKLTDSSLSEDQKYQYLLTAMKSQSVEFIDYLFTKPSFGKLALSPSQQFECWTSLNKCRDLAFEQKLHIATLLSKSGIDADAQDTEGTTILLEAVNNCDNPFVNLLMQQGADPTKEGNVRQLFTDNIVWKKTDALALAKEKGANHIVNLLTAPKKAES